MSQATISGWRMVPAWLSSTARGGLNAVEATAASFAPTGVLVVGDAHGVLRIFSEDGTMMQAAMQAFHERPITHLCIINATTLGAVVVAVAEENISRFATMRMWRLADIVDRGATEEEEEAPPPPLEPLHEHRIGEGANTAPMKALTHRHYPSSSPSSSAAAAHNADAATNDVGDETKCVRSRIVCLDVSRDLTHAAVAFTSADVAVLHATTLADRDCRSSLTWLRTASGAPIAYVGLPEPSSVLLPRLSSPQPIFAVYGDGVSMWSNVRNRWVEHRTCMPFGTSPHCATMLNHRALIVVSSHTPHMAVLGMPNEELDEADAEAYNPLIETSVRRFDVVGSIPANATCCGACGIGEGRVALLLELPHRPPAYNVSCFDLRTLTVAAGRSSAHLASCSMMMADPSTSSLWLVQPHTKAPASSSSSWVWTRLRDAGIATTLAHLLQRQDFETAQRIANQVRHTQPKYIMEVCQHRAEALYRNGRYGEALTFFKQTIGWLAPSDVVRLYAHLQPHDLLVNYLEALHQPEHASALRPICTTALLHAYAHAGDAVGLAALVEREDLHFDVGHAIAVCRSTQHPRAAYTLAEKYARWMDLVRVMIDDLHDVAAAITTLQHMELTEAEAMVWSYGRTMMQHEPQATTALLVEMCVGWAGVLRRWTPTTTNPSSSSSSAPPPPSNRSTEWQRVMHLLADYPHHLAHFARSLIVSDVLHEDLHTQPLYHTYFEMLVRKNLPQRLHIGVDASLNNNNAAAVEAMMDEYAARLVEAAHFIKTYVGRYDCGVCLSLATRFGFTHGVELLQAIQHSTCEVAGLMSSNNNNTGMDALVMAFDEMRSDDALQHLREWIAPSCGVVAHTPTEEMKEVPVPMHW